ncbi:MAG: alginate export family protein [Nitrospirae bacterium]|nr:alginate export family protein [Nitrospirota bacterium]
MMKRKWLKFVLTGVFVAGLVGSSYAEGIKFDGELRLRGVMVDNSDGAAAMNQGGFFEQRTRLNASGTVDENTTVFIQAQDSRTWGAKGPSTTITGTEVESLDLSQGYVKMDNLFSQPLSVTLGRQSLAYGDHRLIGSLEWSNNARRFDAIKFTYKHDVADVDVFWAKVMDVGGSFHDDNNLLGVYANLKVVPQNNIDVYLLDKIVGGGVGTKFYTLGGRIKSDSLKPMNVDLGAELAIQTGDATPTATQNANAYAITAGYTVPAVMGLRIGAEYDAATGDKASTAKKVEGFDNLYPTNHYLYGFNDDINWTNIKAMSVNASVKPMDNMKVAVEYWSYKKAETAAGASDDLGTEINIKANHQKSKNVNCELAYAIRDNGKAGTISSYGGYGTVPKDKSETFGYFMINVKFN